MHLCMYSSMSNFDWNHAKAFLLTTQTGSLTAAAKALGTTQPTLSRQISALESALGVALFERVGRGFELTPGGMDLVEHAEAMGEAAGKLSMAATGQSEQLEGYVCITATEVMAAFELPAIIRELRYEYPGIEIEVISSNSTSDLKRREADIALRGFRPTQPDLVATRACTRRAHLYAAPAYLQALDNPESPADLKQAQFLGFDRRDTMIKAMREYGFDLSHTNFPVVTESHLVQWEMVKQGVGIGFMIESIGDSEPCVERVLPQQPSFDAEIWLVAHREVKSNRRIRTVFDFLATALRAGH